MAKVKLTKAKTRITKRNTLNYIRVFMTYFNTCVLIYILATMNNII